MFPYDTALVAILLALLSVFVVAGVASQHLRLYGAAGVMPADRVPAFRDHVLASAGAVAVVLVFWGLLGALSARPADAPAPAETTVSRAADPAHAPQAP